MKFRNTSHRNELRRSALAIGLGLGLGLLSTGALAQQTAGSIFGTAPAAAGSTVLVTSQSGTSREVTVGADGRYRASNLSVGTYTVTLRTGGTTVSTRNNVQINAGGGTDVSFAGAGAGASTTLEGITVNASALPSIDVTSVNSSTVITAADLKKLPVGRNAESIALLAPGTVAGSVYFGNAVSFGGSSVSENAYYVNGYNTSEPYRNLGGFQLPYGAIEQQQTYTGGYDAKYGRSDGGVINQVGKRGTNQWHFGAQIAVSPKGLDSGGNNTYWKRPNVPAGYTLDVEKGGQLERYKQDNKSWQTIYSAYVGGPLIADKLYMFAAVETTKTKGTNVASADLGTVDRYIDHSMHFYGKLDWNITDSNILELTMMKSNSSPNTGATYEYDSDTRTQGALKSRNDVNKDSGRFFIGTYTGYLTDAATLTVTYGKGRFDNGSVYANSSNNPYISGSASQRGGLGIRNDQTNLYHTNPTDAANSTKGLRADFSYHLGDHMLGVGIDNVENRAFHQGRGMSGPGYAWIYGTKTPTVDINTPLGVGPTGGDGKYVRKYIIEFTTSMSLKQDAYYLQDVWQVADNFQLNLGLRNDRFTNYNDLGIAFVDEKNQWEPRLGFSWDVNGDSSFKVYGNAGRYYLALPDNVAERAANRSTFTSEYFNYTGIDANGIPTGLTPVQGVGGGPAPGPVSSNNELGQPKDAKAVTADNLKAQYQDEFILGFDKTLGPNYVYGAKGIYRELKTAIDDECDPAQLENKMTAMGLNVADYSTQNPYCVLINPGLTNVLNVLKNDHSGYAKVTMTQQDWGYVQGAKRKYGALDLYLEHPFDGKWQARVDYTWAHSFGNAEGQVRSDFGQEDISKTEDWDSWQLMDGSYGNLANDRRHSLRVRGAYQISPEWLVSGTLLVQSGNPNTCLGTFGTDDSNPDPTGYGANYHYCFNKRSPPGTLGTTPWTHKLNLGVVYTPEFADRKLSFGMNVFNVLNEQNVLQRDPITVTGPGQVTYTYRDGLFYSAPRSVRLTASYDF